MPAVSLTESPVRKNSRSELRSAPGQSFNKAAVARLTSEDIASLPDEALTQVILASQIPFVDGTMRERLRFSDRETLERLAFLGRRCCRNQGY